MRYIEKHTTMTSADFSRLALLLAFRNITIRQVRCLLYTSAEKYLNQVVDAGENFIKNSGYKLYTTGDTPYRSLFNSCLLYTSHIMYL